MHTFIVLLRGINVGGHKKFLKSEQVALLQSIHVQNPRVYLHTGNWIFDTSKSKFEIEIEISQALQSQMGWSVPVLVRSISEMKTIMQDCPFILPKKEKSYFLILKSEIENSVIEELSKTQVKGEAYFITKHCIYLFYSKGAGTAKLTTNWFEKALKTEATARNFRTMTQILKLAN